MPRGTGMKRMRLVTAPKRSNAAASLVDKALDFAGCETKAAPMIGCLVLAFYADGATNHLIHKPSVREHNIGGPLFGAWVREAAEHALRHKDAHDTAVDIVNRANGFSDDE